MLECDQPWFSDVLLALIFFYGGENFFTMNQISNETIQPSDMKYFCSILAKLFLVDVEVFVTWRFAWWECSEYVLAQSDANLIKIYK